MDKKEKDDIKYKKIMIFKFTKNHKFTTRLNENGENIDVVNQLKLLGTIITDDLKWDKKYFKSDKESMRMQLLYNAAKFTKSKRDLKHIYVTFIRPVLELSPPVWHRKPHRRKFFRP